MKFEGVHEIALDQASLWQSLHDPEVLAKSIPGCESFEAEAGEEESYRATVATRVGPIKARFNGNVAVENTDPPNAYRLHGGGKAGAAGAAKGDVTITLKPVSDASTELHYDASVAVTGRMAQIGAKMMKGAAEAFAAEFFANLAAQAAPAPEAGATEAPESGAGGAPAFEVKAGTLFGSYLPLAVAAAIIAAILIAVVLR